MPGAEEHLEETSVAEGPNEGMNPNVDMVSNAEAEGRAVSVSPKPGEKRNWDATGGIDRELEVTVLRVLQRHGYQPSASTWGRMVDQGSQIHLSGEVLQASRRPLNKIKEDPSASSMCGGSSYEQSIKGADSFEAAPTAEYTMGEEEILEMEVERLRQLSEEADEMRQVSEMDGFRKDEHLIQACDGTTWEWHIHEDGRQDYYCLDTQESKWTLPDVGEKMGSDEVVGSPSGNELEMETALGPSSSTPTPESTRAFQGSVNSVVEKDFSSTIGDSGLRAGGDAQTSGSPDEEGISGIRTDMAGEHLDREGIEALSEGVAAVKSVDPEDKIPNAEVEAVSATEERVVDVVPGIQEGGPGDLDDGWKKLCITTEEVSSFGAINSAIQGKNEVSEIAGDTVDLKDEAWSANEARANVPDSTWSAEEARVEAHVVSCSADDCNNGAQVSVAADDGGSHVDALVQPEVGGEEQNGEGYTGANVAAVANDGGDSLLETMEPKEPAVEENVPTADDQSNNPAVEENLPAAEGLTKDSNGGSTPRKGEVLPSESLPEVDTERTVTDEAKPLAGKEDGPESLEHKVDDLVGLVQEQDEQLGPEVEARDVPGADEKEVVSEEQTKEVPNEGALVTPGKHFYQAGDMITGLVRYINVHGAFLDHGDVNVLIPAEGKNTPSFKIGDTVDAAVKRVEDDGTVILDSYLVLEEDVEDSSSARRKWKDSGWGTWWEDSWCAGQWYQDSNGQWDWKWEEWQSDEWFADQGLSSEEQEESSQKQLYGEKIYRALLEEAKADKAYLGKITGMLLSRQMDEVMEFVADHALMNNEARHAYNILQSDGWKPDGTECAGLEKTITFSRKQYHNALYELARKKRRYSEPVVGEAVAVLLSQGGDELWNALWLDTKRFLQELDGAVESMSVRENKPMEAYMDPDQCRKVHMTPRTVSPGYSKLCKFFNQGRCRNGSECPYEHRRHGDGWPERGPTEPENSQKAGDEDGDIGSPPTDEGTVDEAQQEREDSAFRAKYNFGKGASKGEPVSASQKSRCVCTTTRVVVNMEIPADMRTTKKRFWKGLGNPADPGTMLLGKP